MTGDIDLRRYVTPNGRDVLGEWLEGLKDLRTRAKIAARVDRLAAGNFGDCKAIRGGLSELRIDWGPRVSDLLCNARQASSPIDLRWR